jgi:hypothetical protein
LSCEENVTHDGAQAQWIRPDVLGTTVLKEITCEGRLL